MYSRWRRRSWLRAVSAACGVRRATFSVAARPASPPSRSTSARFPRCPEATRVATNAHLPLCPAARGLTRPRDPAHAFACFVAHGGAPKLRGGGGGLIAASEHGRVRRKPVVGMVSPARPHLAFGAGSGASAAALRRRLHPCAFRLRFAPACPAPWSRDVAALTDARHGGRGGAGAHVYLCQLQAG